MGSLRCFISTLLYYRRYRKKVFNVRLQSLKKEIDWERSTEERSASSEISTDYRLPPEPVSFSLFPPLYIPIY